MNQQDSKSIEHDPSSEGKFDELDTYVERWEEFEDMFDEFDSLPDHLEAAWWESDLRRRKMDELKQILKGRKKPPFGMLPEALEGLKASLGHFSYVQLEELRHLVRRCEEGLAFKEAVEGFEKSAKGEVLDKESAPDEDLIQQSFEFFNALIQKFYELIARLSLKDLSDRELKGLINVAWASIQTCIEQVKKAIAAEQSPTEIRLIILRFDQQLDALDPDHAFVPSRRDV